MISLAAIAPYARRAARPIAHARCELCGHDLDGAHRHLVDLVERTLRCACPACALLFQGPGQRYRVAPDRWLASPHPVDEARWAALQIPVRLAFFFFHSALGRWVGFYPGPAGATESTLALDAWADFAAACPLTALAEPDVEALLVSVDGHGRCDCLLVPITACYELVGRVKHTWRGFDGGETARAELDAFFAYARSRSDEQAG